MIVVKVELWPGGNPDRAREIARAGVANVSLGLDDSDYIAATFHENVDGKTAAAEGRIVRHNRKAGAWRLVELVAQLAQSKPVLDENGKLVALKKGARRFLPIGEKDEKLADEVIRRTAKDSFPPKMKIFF